MRASPGVPNGLARALPWVGAALLLAGCAPQRPPSAPVPERLPAAATLVPAPPRAVGLDPRLGARIDSVVLAGLAAGAAPGASVAVGRHGRLVHQTGYGSLFAAPEAPPVTDSSIYDLASLTKVVATTTAAMILEDEGRLQLDRPVAFYLPEFAGPMTPGAAWDTAKAAVTVRMLLTHTGGLEAYAPLYRTLRGREAYLRAIAERPLRSQPGTRTVYSDWDMILLQLVIERITGQPLDRFVEDRVFRPLGMRDTMFRPDPSLTPRIAATERDTTRGGLLRGTVHDGNAWAIGGVSGHAGLFSSARDLAVFSQMLLNHGEYGGVRIVRPATVARWTAPQVPGSSRALGWDTPSGRSSAGRFFGPRSFGHTGFTGTSLWIDPERGVFVVLLTNRVNLGGDNPRHTPLRRALADEVATAVLDAPVTEWEARR